VAQRVVEHARPLDPRGLADVRKGDLDALVKRAETLRARAPFAPRLPFAHTPREQALRHYLAAFGIESPPRLDGERPKADDTMVHVLARLGTEKPRASIVHVWAPAPGRSEGLGAAIAALRRHRVEVRWSLLRFDEGVGSDRERRSPVADFVEEAVKVRARSAQSRGERLLRSLGVRVQGRWLVRRPEREPLQARTGTEP